MHKIKINGQLIKDKRLSLGLSRDELNQIYRAENGVDLPILTDEIRSVMDRRLASEDQIAQAETVYGMKAMFQTQEQSGMNDEQWAEYTAAQREAND